MSYTIVLYSSSINALHCTVSTCTGADILSPAGRGLAGGQCGEQEEVSRFCTVLYCTVLYNSAVSHSFDKNN